MDSSQSLANKAIAVLPPVFYVATKIFGGTSLPSDQAYPHPMMTTLIPALGWIQSNFDTRMAMAINTGKSKTAASFGSLGLKPEFMPASWNGIDVVTKNVVLDDAPDRANHTYYFIGALSMAITFLKGKNSLVDPNFFYSVMFPTFYVASKTVSAKCYAFQRLLCAFMAREANSAEAAKSSATTFPALPFLVQQVELNENGYNSLDELITSSPSLMQGQEDLTFLFCLLVMYRNPSKFIKLTNQQITEIGSMALPYSVNSLMTDTVDAIYSALHDNNQANA